MLTLLPLAPAGPNVQFFLVAHRSTIGVVVAIALPGLEREGSRRPNPSSSNYYYYYYYYR